MLTSPSTIRTYGRCGAALVGRMIAGVRSITTRSTTTSSSSSLPSSSPSENVTQRSLFVNVRPAPATLSERRSVLGVLERYGKVELFKKLADNSSFVCIASSTAMATALIKRSPLQYELLAETLQAAQPWGQPRVAPIVQSVVTSSGSASESESWTSSSSTSPSSTSTLAHRSFVVSVFPSQDYYHRTMIRKSPLRGPWSRDEDRSSGPSLTAPVTSNTDGYRETFVHNALKAVVPENASSEALCDWRPRAELATASGNDADVHPAVARIQDRKARQAHAKTSVLSSLVGRSGSNGKSEETKRPNQ
ncbi:hypothetical protein SEUCBS139899_006246 [Sporothrix eucalyptigena]